MKSTKMLDKKQIQLIHLAKTRLKLDDDAYRAILHGRFAAESCKALTYVQAHSLIEHFKSLGFVIEAKPRQSTGRNRRRPLPENVFVLPSAEQMEMVESLRFKIVWRFADGYERWLTRYMHIDRIKTAQEASDTIEGLKGLLANQTRTPDGKVDRRNSG